MNQNGVMQYLDDGWACYTVYFKNTFSTNCV